MASEPVPQPGESDASRIISALVSHGVEFVICGGAACILHGVQRVTADIDLCLRLEADNLNRFIAAARTIGLQPRIPEPLEAIADPLRRRDWVQRKRAVVSTYTMPESMLQLDVFLEYPIEFADLAARATRMTAGSLKFFISSKEDLIRAKQLVRPMRTIDHRDIEDLHRLLTHERQAGSESS